MPLKLHTFWYKLKKRIEGFRKKRIKDRDTMDKMQKDIDGLRGKGIVKNETDGDGGWTSPAI